MIICKDTKEQCKTYSEYLRSNHWQIVKIKFRNKNKPCCSICSESYSLNIHHKTYENLGNEDIKELIYLCKNCHKTVHELLKTNEYKNLDLDRVINKYVKHITLENKPKKRKVKHSTYYKKKKKYKRNRGKKPQ